jgi:hypothetical protein
MENDRHEKRQARDDSNDPVVGHTPVRMLLGKLCGQRKGQEGEYQYPSQIDLERDA